MSEIKVVIKGQEVPVVFSYAALKKLGEKWKINEVSGVFARFSSFSSGEEPGFNELDILGDVVQAGASNAGYEIKSEDAVDVLLKDPSKIQEILKVFIESLPIDKKKIEQMIQENK